MTFGRFLYKIGGLIIGGFSVLVIACIIPMMSVLLSSEDDVKKKQNAIPIGVGLVVSIASFRISQIILKD